MTVSAYARLIAAPMRMSLLMALQYRFDLVLGIVVGLFWSAVSLVPLFVLFEHRTSVAGWAWPEALLVFGTFHVLNGLLRTFVYPSFDRALTYIYNGTFDFLLLKPVDSQFLVSTLEVELSQAFDVITGGAIIAYALQLLGHHPATPAIAVAIAVFALGLLSAYSIALMLVSAAFVAVRVTNLFSVFAALVDLGRWPSSLFRGAISMFFTFVIPLAVMTSYPPLALLDRLTTQQVWLALAIALGFVGLSRQVWHAALRHHTGAGG